MEKAKELTGITEKTALIHEALRILIQKEAAKRLSNLSGSDPTAKAAARRKNIR